MLDIKQAIRELINIKRNTYYFSENECKELFIVLRKAIITK